jgi:hypothetical protein
MCLSHGLQAFRGILRLRIYLGKSPPNYLAVSLGSFALLNLEHLVSVIDLSLGKTNLLFDLLVAALDGHLVWLKLFLKRLPESVENLLLPWPLDGFDSMPAAADDGRIEDTESAPQPSRLRIQSFVVL